MKAPQNLADFLYETASRFPDKKALYHKEGGHYRAWTWGETASRTDRMAAFLTAQGLRAGDRIAILSENRPEWLVMDFAALSLGVVSVPIYTSLTPSEIQFILADSGCRWIAVSGKPLFEKFASIQKKLATVEGVVVFDGSLAVSRADISIPMHTFMDILSKTAPGRRPTPSPRPDDLATLIYTSGTTGVPKGAMLTHGNFVQNSLMAREAFKMSESERHLSFLPLSHVFERTCGHFLMTLIGATIAYAENMDTVPRDIQEMQPTYLLGVPRFYEKVQARVLEAVGKAGPLKKGLFVWARELGRKKRLREKMGLLDILLRPIAEALVYRKFGKGLGGRLRFGVSGGAPLPKEIAEFFCDLGIWIYEGYGLTETAPVITANREGRCRFGSVGLPFPGIEVRLAEDGEILTRSACVMKGYHNKPEETAEALAGGWFHTGDLGRFDSDGYLFITGRKKELICTSGGKKISPRPIEERLESDPYVLRCVLFGEGRKFLTALIVPRKTELLEYAASQKIAHDDYASLLKQKSVYDFFDQRIRENQKDLAPYERMKYFALLENDFSQAAGELTPTLKVKRETVLSRHKDLLLPFYVE